MSFRLGLTGSIGMGKSTTAEMFVDQGCDLWDADAAVHRLYDVGGAAVTPVAAAFPEAIRNGAVSREVLRKIIARDPRALKTIESIVHPLVARDRADFASRSKADIIVFDVPLLFETGGDKMMDAVACVSVQPELQKSRVMARGTMSHEQFQHINRKQMSNAEKCDRADYVIVTDTLDHARRQVHDIVAEIRRGLANA